jgi:hypothetical protein
MITVMASAGAVQFEGRTLADDLTGGDQVVACDVNGDGKLDLDGNGRPDIACIGQATNNLKLWRNLARKNRNSDSCQN